MYGEKDINVYVIVFSGQECKVILKLGMLLIWESTTFLTVCSSNIDFSSPCCLFLLANLFSFQLNGI